MGSKQRPALLPKRPTYRTVCRGLASPTRVWSRSDLFTLKNYKSTVEVREKRAAGGQPTSSSSLSDITWSTIDRSQGPCAKRSVVVRRSRGEIAGCEEKRRLVSSEIICRSESTPIAEAFRLPFAGTLTGRAPRGGDSSGGDAAVTTAALSSTPYHKNILITILGGGSLGSCVDEERSKMREQM